MRIHQFIWDLPDDVDGNVQHLAENDVTIEEAEEVLLAAKKPGASQSSGLPIVFGFTVANRHLAVVFEIVEKNPLAVRVITAYETDY